MLWRRDEHGRQCNGPTAVPLHLTRPVQVCVQVNVYRSYAAERGRECSPLVTFEAQYGSNVAQSVSTALRRVVAVALSVSVVRQSCRGPLV
jgi:hypothetical protein